MAERRTFRAGVVDCTVVTDGELPYPPAMLFANADAHELERALAGELDANGMVAGRFNPLLVRGPEDVVLVDSGFGSFAPGPGAGRLLESLRIVGITPADVQVVVLTHAHSDHLGGLLADGDPVFRHARHLLLRIEWEFWSSSPPGRESVVAAVEQALRPLHEAGLLDLVEPGTQVTAGVRVTHAPGHTPGHAVVELGDPPAAIFLADAVLHEAGFEHPEWTSAFDSERDRAAETRRLLLGRAAREGLLVAAYHLGRFGRVTRAGDTFAFAAETE